VVAVGGEDLAGDLEKLGATGLRGQTPGRQLLSPFPEALFSGLHLTPAEFRRNITGE
jgi:hypothetical protein